MPWTTSATVPIYYESRLAKLDVNPAEIEQLNHDVDEVVEDEEMSHARTQEQMGRTGQAVGAQPRLQQVAADLVKHFETRTATLEGKAMIVCMSREICVRSLQRRLCGCARSGTAKDPKRGRDPGGHERQRHRQQPLQPHLYTKQRQKRLEKRFKDPTDPLKLVIVRDMWLTGFDAPCCTPCMWTSRCGPLSCRASPA